MADKVLALQTFARVARTGNFSAAARELGLSQPSVSRIVATLEEEIGAALLSRTTRALTLTEAGADYLTRIEPILTALEEADHAARGTGELRGLLRIGAPVSFATRAVIPLLPQFMERHPELQVDFALADHRQDLVNEAIDVLLRVGKLEDSSTVARRLCISPRVIVASPSYLARAGTPTKPADIGEHCVVVGPSGKGSEGWAFRKDGEDVFVNVRQRLTMNVNEASVAAAIAGLGIVTTMRCSCRSELDSGALVQLLPEWQIGHVEVHALFLGARALKPSARAFVDFLAEALRGG